MHVTQEPALLQPKTPSGGGWTRKILTALRLTNAPVVRVYRSFGTPDRWTVQGHVLRLSPLPRKRYRRNWLTNTVALLRLFMVRPWPNAIVRLAETGQTTQADTDGFFRFEVDLPAPRNPGWHPVTVELITMYDHDQTRVLASGTGQLLIPHPTRYGCISDIDDTFLISYSARIIRRLTVLLTRNAHTRKPFAGVVAHYRFLATLGTSGGQANPFFYVSSSEWNLYDALLIFSEHNGLPDGIFLLSQIKRLSQVLQTGGTKHMTKLDRIARVLATFPQQRFILLGDDTQADPMIYEEVVRHHPDQIRAVYVRQVHAPHRARTQNLLDKIRATGIPVCYFAHSADALTHSLLLMNDKL
jgi:phosphatidate phosphatase APP1